MTTFFDPEPAPELRAPQRGLRTALTIAGVDPSGGAGIIADARTFVALGVWPLVVPTTLTYQNTTGLKGRYDVPGGVVLRELEELFGDRRPNAIKTGAMGSLEIIREVGLFLDAAGYDGPFVVDPVISATSGASLMEQDALESLALHLLPRATVVTPNAAEAARLSGFRVEDLKDAEAAALRIASMGPRAVLITGIKTGPGDAPMAADVFCDREEIDVYTHPWQEGLRVHGTGCVLSAALAAGLARGLRLKDSVDLAQRVARAAIEGSLATGTGHPNAIPEALMRPGPARDMAGGADGIEQESDCSAGLAPDVQGKEAQ